MSFAVKAIKKVGGAIFGGSKTAAPPAAATAAATGPRVTQMPGAQSVSPRKRGRSPFGGLSAILTDKLGG